MHTKTLCRLAASLVVLCLVSASRAAPPSCGRECKAKSAYKPNCLAKGCQCADKCDCKRLGRCCAKCRCSDGKLSGEAVSSRRPGDPFRIFGLPNYNPRDSRVYDALDEVNAARRSWGLPPYVRDESLSRGAKRLVKFRADRLIKGHTNADFAALPSGAHAKFSGCGACDTSWGWYCCATEDRLIYAGAAWCWGRDGKRYQQLFVR